MEFGAVGVAFAPEGVVNETVWMFVVKDGENAIFYLDAFARKSNDAFDDVLVFDARRSGASKLAR